MPSLVFPAPGAPYATQLSATFSGFDMAPVTRTTIKNLLLDSETFVGMNWTVGPYSIPFNAVTDYITDSILQSNVTVTKIGLESQITALSNTQRIGQQINVLPNTTYTFSFYARRGTATDNRYKILDFSRNTDLVSPTSYYSQINGSTLTRITVTFTTTLNTSVIVLYPVWDITSGYGTSYITNAQFELGSSATTYQTTYTNANSSSGIIVNRGVGFVKLQNIKQPVSNIVTGRVTSNAKLKSVASLETKSKLTANTKLKSVASLETKSKLTANTKLKAVGASISSSNIEKAKFPNPSDLRTNYGLDNRLSTFDNVGLVEGTIYTVTSVDSGVRANTVLDYIYDFDKVTTTITPVTQLVVSFDNTEMRYVFGVGSYVTLTNTANAPYTTQVLARTPNSVTIAKPFNWDPTWSFITIANASVSVFPQANVIPTTHPTTPREWLLYSTMIPTRGASFISTVYTKSLWDAYFFNYTGTTQSLASGTLQLPVAKMTGTRSNIQQGNLKAPTFRLTSAPAPRLGVARSIAKLAPDSSYSIVTSATPSSKIQFYPAVNVVGSNLYTSATVIWYINENDILMSVPSGSSLITLYFDPLMPGTYSTARISQNAYINTFSIISHTVNSITFLNPGDLPSVSGMLLELGSTANYTDYTYTYRNTAPTLSKFTIAYTRTQVFDTPQASKLTAGIKVKGDNTRIVAGRANAINKLKGTTDRLFQATLEKGIFKLKGDRNYPITTTVGTETYIVYAPTGVPVTGRSGVITTTASWYTNEDDILTVLPTGSNVVTLYFDPIFFDAYSLVRISHVSSIDVAYNRTFSVISKTNYSVTILDPLDLPSVSGMTISFGYTITGPTYTTTVPRQVGAIDRFKVPFANTHVFSAPTVSKLSATQVLRDTRSTLAQANLNLQIFKLSGDVRITASQIEKLKVPFKNTQVFYTPISNKLTSAQVLKDIRVPLPPEMLSRQSLVLKTTRAPLPPEMLSRQSIVVKDTRSILTQSNINLQVFKLAGDVRITAAQIEKLKVPSTNTQVFYTPISNKLTSSQVLKSVTSRFTADKATVVSKLKTDSTVLKSALLERYKVSYNATQVFYTPLTSKLSSAQVLKDIRVPLPPEMLSKQSLVLKDTRSKLLYSNLALQVFKLSGDVRITASQIEKLKVPFANTQVFYTPLSNKLTSTSVLKSTTFDARVNKLISTATLRPIVPDIRYSYIEKLKVPYRNTFVFETPLSNKLTANAVLKADRSTIRLSSFKVSAIPLKDLSYNIKTSYLSKPVTTLKQGATVFNYYNIDNTFYQSNVITNVAPTNAREVLFYSIMAPGYRTNNSIQQGKVFSPVESKITTNRLEVFDNVRFSSAPFYNVTSQSAGIRANTVLDYIYDLDIITVNTTPTNVLQISFDNTERQFTLPYPIGSYIGLTVTNHSDYFAQVLDSTFNTVTIALPEDWEAHDWIPLVIGSASPSVFPKVQVKPNGRPTTAREILFYSEMAAGFLQSRTIQDGELFGGPQDSTIRRITYLERDAWRVTEIRNSSLYSLASLIKAGAVVKGTERKGTLPGKILPRTNIKAMPFRNPFGQVERVRWGINPNYGTRFSEVIRLESFGGIIRFKTGIFNKMHDVSVKKKEPIQFWN